MEAPAPVLVIAGALGAGKTTLLARWLADPAFARTAVIIDEMSDMVVDPHLLAAPGAQVRRAPCGGRWSDALHGLARDGFERVIVEASGVATPARMLDALAEDEVLSQRFTVAGVVTAVDAVAGDKAFDEPHVRAQAAGADAVVLTKLDMAEPETLPALTSALLRINPYADILRASSPAFVSSSPWTAVAHAPARELRRLQGLADDGAAPQVGALCVKFAHPVELSGFCVRLAAFLEQHAGRLLRVKGLVRVEGRHGPAVIQAVGSTLYPVRTLKEWPAGVEESALMVVARDMADDVLRVGVESAGATRRSRLAR